MTFEACRDNELQLRALGLGDTLHLRELLARALEAGGSSMVTLFTDGLPSILRPLSRWLTTLTELPRPWTLTDFALVLEAVSQHRDMVQFLSHLIPPEEPSAKPAGVKRLELRHILDLVQARYGWHDSYLVNVPGQPGDYLSYTRWLEVVETVLEAQAVESRDAWRRAAFTNWAFYYFQPRGEHSDPMGLSDWFAMFGLQGDDDYCGQTDEEALQAAHELMLMLGFERSPFSPDNSQQQSTHEEATS